MAKQKLTQVTVQGLATNPNPNALPAGSCAVLNNAVMRRPGIISPTPEFVNRVELSDVTFPPRKLMYSDFAQNVIAIGENGFVPIELPDTEKPEVVGLPIDAFGGERAISFLPGRTQTAYSHFRSFITERSGIVVNNERWAGLPPPAGMQLTAFADTDGFLLDTYGVAYRAHFSLESTDDVQPYIMDGPVSAIPAIINDVGALCETRLSVFAPGQEPFFIPSGCKLYLSIYRSTQAIVSFVSELAEDFRRVGKIELSAPSDLNILFVDHVSDEARASGEPLYTNSGETGAEASSWAPPAASDICIFKDTTFYTNRASMNVLTLTVPGSFGELLSNQERLTGVGTRSVLTASTTLGSDQVVFVDPDEIIGVVPGQLVTLLTLPSFTYVVSVNVGTLTVTVSEDATATNSGLAGDFTDMIKVQTFPELGGGITQVGRVTRFDIDCVGNGNLFGYRMLYPAFDFSRAEQGISLQLTYTWNAIGVVDRFTVALTNGQNYSPAYTGDYVTNTDPLISLNDIRPNRVFFSKTGTPEAVPVSNYRDVGAGTLLKMWANQSALFCFCTDGLWKITGDGADITVYQIDPTAILVHPDAVGSLNNTIYAWLTDGIATVTEDGATTISTDAVGPQLRALHTSVVQYFAPYSWGVSLCGDSFRNEVWLIANSISHEVDSSFAEVITYNDDTKNFSNQVLGPQNSDLLLSAAYAPNVSRTTFLAGATSDDSSLRLPSDYDTEDPQTYLPMEVWFNPLQTEDKGNLKQWMDLNYFTANYVASGDEDYLKAVFDARGDCSDATAITVNVNNMASLKRDIHYLVPRRTALSDQQQIGFVTYTLDGEEPDPLETAFYVEVQGFTMRYRICSDTLKK